MVLRDMRFALDHLLTAWTALEPRRKFAVGVAVLAAALAMAMIWRLSRGRRT